MGWVFDLGGASALAGAAGFAVSRLGPPDYLPYGAAVAASLAFLAAYAVLRRIDAGLTALPLSAFSTIEIELEPEPEALLLDDRLAGVAADSQVVRLFAPDDLPTAGELKQRIDRHVGLATDADAADALHQALAEIRKSLR